MIQEEEEKEGTIIEIGPILQSDERSWDWFSNFVKQLRKLNEALLAYSESHIMVSVDMIDRDINGYRSFVPHAINLHTQKEKGGNENIDIKRLFLMRRSGVTD